MRTIVCLLTIALMSSGCAKNLVPFTQGLRESQRFDEGILRQIQFYTSSDITIHRKLKSGETEIEGGTIKFIDGREVEEVIIPEGTKGVAVLFPGEDRIGVSFEKDDSHFLVFGPKKEQDRRYILRVADITNKSPLVTYNGRKWELSRRSSDAHLLVDLKRIKKWDVDQRVAKGRSVD